MFLRQSRSHKLDAQQHSTDGDVSKTQRAFSSGFWKIKTDIGKHGY